MQKHHTRFVVAIDFGTSRSGYAYAASHHPDEVIYQIIWPDQISKTEKTPTLLLIDPDKKVIKCGYTAMTHLAELTSKQASQGYALVDMFKMNLHRSDEPGSSRPRTVRGDHSLDTYQMIVDYLAWLRGIAIDRISQRVTAAWDEKEVRWCLSVPAIWSNEAKGLMRAAAVDAGFIESGQGDAHRLNLVLEPEAAAIYCQLQNAKSEQFQINPGETFIVVDAGGGTLDITAHRVTDDGELDALTEASGGPFGSMYVDREFLRWLSGILGTLALEELNTRFQRERLEMLEKWEVIKCQFDGEPNWKNKINLPNRFYLHLQKSHPDALRVLAAQQDDEDYFVSISYTDMIAIFEPVISNLLNQIELQFQQIDQPCDYLFFVGGFAESRFLQRRIREKFDLDFDGLTKVVVPDHPGRAILGGAVAYGLNPGLIRTRKSRWTYGVGGSGIYDPKLDAGRPTYLDDDRQTRYDGRFSIFVRRGQSVPVDHETSVIFTFPIASQEVGEFSIYRTRKTDPRYIDEKDVFPLNKELKVKLPMGKSREERRVRLTMYFGGTEVRIVAEQVFTGQKVESTFDLASSYFPEDDE